MDMVVMVVLEVVVEEELVELQLHQGRVMMVVLEILMEEVEEEPVNQVEKVI